MFDRIFGKYLLETGVLTKEQLLSVYEKQGTSRSRLGLIAVTEKMMTIDQVDEVNKLQAIMDKRFGDIAITSGYLTDEQVGRLLKLQGNRYLVFIQVIVDKGYLTLDTINSVLNLYQNEHGYTLTDLENLKSCEIDRIVPYFVDIKDETLFDLVGTFVRTVARLMNYNVFLEPSFEVDSYSAPQISYQISDGDHKLFVCIAADGESMMGSAISFAGKKFIDNQEDALDANAEFINCVNGLFATKVSNDEHEIELDMYPPIYHESSSTIIGNHIYVIPVNFEDISLKLLVSIDSDIQIK
jgi:hypothetical protein